MLVIDKEVMGDSLVLQLNSVNSKNKAIVRGKNSIFMELWLPNFKSYRENIIKDATVFDIEINTDFERTYKNLKKLEKLKRVGEK